MPISLMRWKVTLTSKSLATISSIFCGFYTFESKSMLQKSYKAGSTYHYETRVTTNYYIQLVWKCIKGWL